MSLHLRNLEIFCEVAALRSFSRAAEAHSVSQSTASQTVHGLEDHLGVQLLDRSKRPLELTPAGRVYLEGCRQLLDSFQQVEDRVRAMRNQVSGQVRVAAIYSVGLLQMEQFVRQFHTSYPDTHVTLDYRHPDVVYERIRRGEADLGLVSFPRETRELACIPWQEQAVNLVVSVDHRLANRKSVSVGELDGLPLVALTGELAIRRETDHWLAGHGVSVEVVHEFDNIENIKRDVEVGTGAALLPAPTVERETEIGTLVSIPIENCEFRRPLGIVYDRQHYLSSAAEKFVDLLRLHPDDSSAPLRPPDEEPDPPPDDAAVTAATARTKRKRA